MGKEFFLQERSYEFSKKVVLFLNRQQFSRIHQSILDQLVRSATSITANIIEARTGTSRKNLIYYLSVALRSANETRFWLRLIGDTMRIDSISLNELMKEAEEVAKILGKSILTLKRNNRNAC